VVRARRVKKIRLFGEKSSILSGKIGTLITVPDEVTNNAENQQLKAQNELLKRENALLKEKINLLIRRIFGVKSEKLDPGQLELLLSQAEEGTDLGKAEASAPPEAAPIVEKFKAALKDKRKSEHRERWPKDLPVVEEILEPEEVKANPLLFRFIGQEVSETLDYEPARFLCRRIVRRKYVSRTEVDKAPVIAALPESLQERCVAAPGLLAQLIVSKFCDHLPLYRQEQIYTESPPGVAASGQPGALDGTMRPMALPDLPTN